MCPLPKPGLPQSPASLFTYGVHALIAQEIY